MTSYRGKGNPVKNNAKKNGIKCMDWITLDLKCPKVKYDLGVSVSFGHLIPENITNMFP